LYEIDKGDPTQKHRVAIWVIDLGLRDDKLTARGAINNVQSLANQFQAIALIRASGQQELFEWLKQHVCIVVGSLQGGEIDRIYSQAGISLPPAEKDRPWFQSDRLFLESVPRRWLDAEGSDAFGKTQAELWEAPTITAHLKLGDWKIDHPDEVDALKNLRYYFHGSLLHPSEENDGAVRCIPLPQPGSRWSDGYRLACNAAFYRLGHVADSRLGDLGTPQEALAHLRDQYFAALLLDEFLHLPNLLVDRVDDSVTNGELQ